jgi:hypothetical protein
MVRPSIIFVPNGLFLLQLKVSVSQWEENSVHWFEQESEWEIFWIGVLFHTPWPPSPLG